MNARAAAPGAAGGGRVEVRVYDDPEGVAAAAAGEVERLLARAIEARGVARWALAGGTTPDRLHDLLAAEPDRIDWPRLELFWGDERAVPPEHPESNFGRARARLLDRLPVAPGRVWRIRGELPPERAAREYEERLRRIAAVDSATAAAAGSERPPRLDLVLLGLGSDGHTASLFPGSDPEPGRWVVATRAPGPPRDRVSLTPPVLARARAILFLVTGAGKAEALARVIEGGGSAPPPPAAGVRPSDGSVVWLVDRAAAERLERRAVSAPTRPGGPSRRLSE